MSQMPPMAHGNTVVVSQTPSLSFIKDGAGPTLCGILHGMDGSQTHHLGERTIIGRGPQCHLQLNDDRISAVQCCIMKEPEGMVLEDRSTNGSFLNGDRVGKGRRFRLRSGDEISFVLLKRKRARRDQVKSDNEFLTKYSFQAYGEQQILNFKPGSGAGERESDKGRVIKNWQLGGLIGTGGYSKVYVGIDADTGEMIAVKTIQCAKPVERGAGEDDDDESTFNTSQGSASATIGGTGDTMAPPMNGGGGEGHLSEAALQKKQDHRDHTLSDDPMVANELSLLQNLSHPRIVQFYGYHYNKEERCWRLLLEYVSGGALNALISKFGGFCENVVRLYALQILQGLEYLHGNGVVHGDIKPANILVTDKGAIKISDFGTSQLVRPSSVDAAKPSSVLCGTPFWMSPELIRNQRHTFASDIWAFGCVVLEMATGHPPWEELRESLHEPAQVIFALGTATNGPSLERLDRRVSSSASLESAGGNSWLFSPTLKHFISSCFELDHEQRPTTTDLLRHSFFTQTHLSQPSQLSSLPVLASAQRSQGFPGSAQGGHFDPHSANAFSLGANDQAAVLSLSAPGNPVPSPSTFQEHVQFLSDVPRAPIFGGMASGVPNIAKSSGLTSDMERLMAE